MSKGRIDWAATGLHLNEASFNSEQAGLLLPEDFTTWYTWKMFFSFHKTFFCFFRTSEVGFFPRSTFLFGNDFEEVAQWIQ